MPPTGHQDSTGEDQGAKPQPGVPQKIDDILLPKKEVHTPASAQRVNAGALLSQEQQVAQQPAPQSKKAEVPPAPPAPPKEESSVRPLETYRSDIESVIQQKKVSVVSIAADEAKRRDQAPISGSQASTGASHDLGFTIAAVSGGLLLLAGAAGLLTFLFLRPQADAPVVNTVPAPFIAVDDTRLIAIPAAQWQRNTVLGTADLARQSTGLSLGLMARLYLTQATNTNALPPVVPIDTFLSTVAPNASSELLRSFTGEYLLGVHSYDGNQAFLILGVEGFEAAYAGMLAWEISMPQELSPLFTRTPRPRIPEEEIIPAETTPIFLPEEAGTSTASTTPAATTTAETATTTPAQEEELPAFFRTQFVDRIVENYDARVMQDENGDILLLWTFLDRNTLVITTNDATLREIISRRSRPPVVPL